ncbi:unnamed protein product [Larinioides sclopetarius]|uniref:RING-type domain-containing protein n=1 Tax=Larinioides sclopetarius TaxID=280406 RepID=A0AAV2ARF6_9ARAC
MGRVRKQATKPLIPRQNSASKRKRGRPRKLKLPPSEQAKEKVTKCCVCLDTTRYRKMKSLHCSHSFHEKCINKWMETNKKCPLCRMSFGQEKDKKDLNESSGNDQVEEGEMFYVPSGLLNRMLVMQVFRHFNQI